MGAAGGNLMAEWWEKYHFCNDLCKLFLRFFDGRWYIIPNVFGEQQIPIKFCPWCGEELKEVDIPVC